MYRYIHPVYFVYKIKLFASITWGVFERNSHSLALNSITGKKKHTEAKQINTEAKQKMQTRYLGLERESCS